MLNQIRQGDILLERVEGVKPPSSVAAQTEVVLAEGELTGHAHKVRATRIYDWSVEGQRYIQVGDSYGELFHDDHDPEPVKVLDPETTWRVTPQKEMNLKGEWKEVID